MTPEDAYSILEAIADIHGFSDKLVRYTPTQEEITDNQVAEEIEDEHKEKLAPFRFSMCNIKPGNIIEYCNSSSSFDGETCEVINDKEVKYKNKIWSLSALAQVLGNLKYPVAGPKYFKFNGEWLNDIRNRSYSEN